jgi:hypothetical protein
MTDWLDADLWDSVADAMREHIRAGLTGVLTEDTLRFATAQAIARTGADARELRVEWPHPTLPGSRIDLVFGKPDPRVLVEFKFPREPSEKNAAWTMVLGEVLKDLYRLASVPGDATRLFVYLEGSRLRTYMAGAAQRFGLNVDADVVALRPEDAAKLPSTAAAIVGAELAANHVTATRVFDREVLDGLHLAVYVVDPHGTVSLPAAITASAVTSPAAPMPSPAPSPDRTTARVEILDAARDVLSRSGRSFFTLQEVLDEMARRSTRYAEATIRTMVTSHMCANAPNHAAVTYEDFERLDRGEYRFTS